MTSSNQMKLEERETRKMLAQARLSKKAAAKKQKSKKNVPAAEPTKRYIQKRVLVLKSDLQPQSGEVKSAVKSNNKKKQRPSQELPAGSNVIEPPFSYEVHHKNKQVLVNVSLNKVPPQCIQVDSTTASTLVVQTPKYTKKYHLAFNLPSNIKIDPKKAEYTFETGILKCVLPIVGDIPDEILKERSELVEQFKAQKGLRFRMSKEGELVVRSRRTVLKADSGVAPKPSTSTTPKAAKQVPAASTKVNLDAVSASLVTKKATSAVPPAQQKPNAPSVSSKKNKQFVDDGKAMLNVAVASGKEQRNQLYQRLEKARSVQQTRVERQSKREVKKSVKREKSEATFARVIAEQKEQLLKRADLAKPAPVKASAASNKKVSFA